MQVHHTGRKSEMKEKKTKDGSAVCYASAEFSHGSRYTQLWLGYRQPKVKMEPHCTIEQKGLWSLKYSAQCSKGGLQK